MNLKTFLEVVSNCVYVEVDFVDGSVVSDYPVRLLRALDDEELNLKVVSVNAFADPNAEMFVSVR